MIRALRPRARLEGGEDRGARPENTTRMWRLERSSRATESEEREDTWHEHIADPLGATVPLPPPNEDGG